MIVDQRVLTFLQVATMGSFSKAASAQYMSPVSVMKQVNALESELGIELLVRSHAGCKPSPAGSVLIGDLERIVSECDEAVSRARRVAEGGKHVVRVGASALRPAGPLVDLWGRVGRDLPYRIEIVPYMDEAMGFDGLASLLGRRVDCIVGPCDSARWREECSVLELGRYDCMLGVPEGHRLSDRSSLTWDDLAGERLMLVRRGLSPVLDALRDEIEMSHADVRIIDAPGFYSMRMFNDCVSEGFLMETLSAWSGVHPSVRSIPMEWGYRMPYGIVYAKEPSDAMSGFVEGLAHAMA